MADALTTITNLINSPPGQLVAGGVLAGIVWKFFEKVESVLKDDTKLEIAVWLLDVRVGKKVETWPQTFETLFETVFAHNHFSTKCFGRSCFASLVSLVVLVLITMGSYQENLLGEPVNVSYFTSTGILRNQITAPFWKYLAIASIVGLIIPDYISLFETRLMLRVLRWIRGVSVGSILVLVLDGVITFSTAIIGANVGYAFSSHFLEAAWLGRVLEVFTIPGLAFDVMHRLTEYMREVFLVSKNGQSGYSVTRLIVFPGCLSSIWLWLYVASGFIVKFSRWFDAVFDWFNSKVDIERKPLSAIGLVAGALVAVVGWTAVVVGRVL
jgi:hypothetical protein